MRIFKDANKVEWEVNLTIRSARSLDERLRPQGIDLFDARSMIGRLGGIFFAIDCISILCAEQMEKRNIFAAAFGDALKGASAFEAQRAMIGEYVDFFPDPSIQETLRQSLEKVMKTSEREQELIRRAVENAAAKYEKTVDSMAARLSESISSDSPPSPDSESTIRSSRGATSKNSPSKGTKRSGKNSRPARSTRTRT